MAQFGARRVLILTDPQINELGIPARIADSLTRHGITSEIFDGCHVEPTDDSMDKAAGYARGQGPWDGFVAVGGGSPIDTAKAVNLLTTDEGLADGLTLTRRSAVAARPAASSSR